MRRMLLLTSVIFAGITLSVFSSFNSTVQYLTATLTFEKSPRTEDEILFLSSNNAFEVRGVLEETADNTLVVRTIDGINKLETRLLKVHYTDETPIVRVSEYDSDGPVVTHLGDELPSTEPLKISDHIFIAYLINKDNSLKAQSIIHWDGLPVYEKL